MVDNVPIHYVLRWEGEGGREESNKDERDSVSGRQGDRIDSFATASVLTEPSSAPSPGPPTLFLAPSFGGLTHTEKYRSHKGATWRIFAKWAWYTWGPASSIDRYDITNSASAVQTPCAGRQAACLPKCSNYDPDRSWRKFPGPALEPRGMKSRGLHWPSPGFILILAASRGGVCPRAVSADGGPRLTHTAVGVTRAAPRAGSRRARVPVRGARAQPRHTPPTRFAKRRLHFLPAMCGMASLCPGSPEEGHGSLGILFPKLRNRRKNASLEESSILSK